MLDLVRRVGFEPLFLVDQMLRIEIEQCSRGDGDNELFRRKRWHGPSLTPSDPAVSLSASRFFACWLAREILARQSEDNGRQEQETDEVRYRHKGV